MKITIKITSYQAGTEYGELCQPTYKYECNEFNAETDIENKLSYDEELVELTVEDMNLVFKATFLTTLNTYLNKNFLSSKPGQWDNENYEDIINKIRKQTSSPYSVDTRMVLFPSQVLDQTRDSISLTKKDFDDTSFIPKGP